jgi:virginiamycin B lyase
LVRGMRRSRVLLALGIVVFLSVSLLYLSLQLPGVFSCGERIGLATVSEFNLQSVHFGGVTKFRLPGDRFPNGITTISDGSVWFGEQNLPGVAHLYPNGTMREYAWPISYSPSTTSIWGVAQWNGRVWASDALGSQVVGLDPSTATVYAVKLSDSAAFPYTMTVAPDGTLWFTELFVSKLGRIDAQCRLKEYALPLNFGGTPTEIKFQNSSAGYYVDAGNTTSGIGKVLSFDPNHFSPQLVDGEFTLRAPSSLALVERGVWVTQHAASNLAYYDSQSRQWTLFPTSPVSYFDSTLPYFVAANGSQVWFNEHYANRMAKLDAKNGLLTEYSLSDPPPTRITGIDNALTFSLGDGKAWFTELTASYVGYVEVAYKPNFKISTPSTSTIKLKPGATVNVTLTVSGQSQKPLTFLFADTENFTGRPQKITMNSNVTQIESLDGQKTVVLKVAANESLTAGRYTLLVTVTDGLVDQGAYLELEIEA